MVIDRSIIQTECFFPDEDAHLHEGQEQVENEPEVAEVNAIQIYD